MLGWVQGVAINGLKVALALSAALAASVSCAAAQPLAAGWAWESDASIEARGRVSDFEAETNEEIEIGGSAWIGDLAASLMAERGATNVTFNASTIAYQYLEDDRADRQRTELAGEIMTGVNAKLRAGGGVSYVENESTPEFVQVDQWMVRGVLDYAWSRAHLTKLEIDWRERDYDDATGSSGAGPAYEALHRVRFNANHFLTGVARFEEIRSDDNDRRDMQRVFASLAYYRPLGDRLRLRPEVSLRRTEFSGRALVQSLQARFAAQKEPT